MREKMLALMPGFAGCDSATATREMARAARATRSFRALTWPTPFIPAPMRTTPAQATLTKLHTGRTYEMVSLCSPIWK